MDGKNNPCARLKSGFRGGYRFGVLVSMGRGPSSVDRLEPQFRPPTIILFLVKFQPSDEAENKRPRR